jgi:hypothetical protein
MTLTRAVRGQALAEVALALTRLAELHELAGDLGEAVNYRQRVHDLQTKLAGGKNWRTADARLALAFTQKAAGWAEAKRTHVVGALQKEQEAARLEPQGAGLRRAFEHGRTLCPRPRWPLPDGTKGDLHLFAVPGRTSAATGGSLMISIAKVGHETHSVGSGMLYIAGDGDGPGQAAQINPCSRRRRAHSGSLEGPLHAGRQGVDLNLER